MKLKYHYHSTSSGYLVYIVAAFEYTQTLC